MTCKCIRERPEFFLADGRTIVGLVFTIVEAHDELCDAGKAYLTFAVVAQLKHHLRQAAMENTGASHAAATDELNERIQALEDMIR